MGGDKKHEFGSWNAECGKQVMAQGLTFYLTPHTFYPTSYTYYRFFGVGAGFTGCPTTSFPSLDGRGLRGG
jgi:hypothetical protein